MRGHRFRLPRILLGKPRKLPSLFFSYFLSILFLFLLRLVVAILGSAAILAFLQSGCGWFDQLLFVVLARAVGESRRVTEVPTLTESERHWRGIPARKMVLQRPLFYNTSLARLPEPRHVSLCAGHRRSQQCTGDARCWAAICIDPVRGSARPVPVTDAPPAPCLLRTLPGRHFGSRNLVRHDPRIHTAADGTWLLAPTGALSVL